MSAFFLGFVFMSSLQYITCSTFVHDLFRKIREIVLRAIPLKKARIAKDVENPFGSPEKHGLLIQEEARSSIHANDHNALVFTLNLSLVLASLAMLLSQLTYSDVGGSETVCGESILYVRCLRCSRDISSSLCVRLGRDGCSTRETDWVRDPHHGNGKDEGPEVGTMGAVGYVVGCPWYVSSTLDIWIRC